MITYINKTTLNRQKIQSIEFDSKDKKYYFEVMEDDTGRIISIEIKDHIIHNKNDIEILIEILEVLRDYNWLNK